MARRRKIRIPRITGGRKNSPQAVIIAIVLAVFALLSDERMQSDIFGWVYVTDGDSLAVDGRKIRLFGIDAPELAQECTRDGAGYPCGQAARRALKDIIGKNDISCTTEDTDKYGRDVAVCFLGDLDINREMVRQGWALAYRQYSRAYVAEEDTARRAKRGIWQGDFDAPEDFRRRKNTRDE